MNGDVYRFVYNNVERTNQDPKPDSPPLPNGTNPKAHKPKALAQKSEVSKDVGPKKMNGDVYRFVYNNVERTNQDPKPDSPPLPNGSNPKAHKPKALAQKSEVSKDVGPKKMNGDVYRFV